MKTIKCWTVRNVDTKQIYIQKAGIINSSYSLNNKLLLFNTKKEANNFGMCYKPCKITITEGWQ